MRPHHPWDVHRLPRADDRTFLVTGANAGIGYFVAEQLAGTGATVLLGARSATKAAQAMTAIRARVPDARLHHRHVDLSDPTTLTADGLDRLDAVVCNAGVLLSGPRRTTAAGHELTFATNHLGHFTLVANLLPLLAAAPAGRVVTTGSFVAKSADLDLADLHCARDYTPDGAYAKSKLAQMLFGFELARRLEARGSTTISVVDHPGGALDTLTPPRPPLPTAGPARRLTARPAALVLQGKHAGAWPAVRATLDPNTHNGDLWAPRAFGLRGTPVRHRVHPTLSDPTTATRLWEASAELTGTTPP
ncbi:SDR family NAD(P)-dependent oxidoreductase [Actinosynnema sp. NPDC020468]|uniref:SDR family NAD(P)-dependent oxidoreductase n=1 Tax=Actinosynnema sp. NPDC020468 TaxID=3154488 RepID=UPI0033D6E27B